MFNQTRPQFGGTTGFSFGNTATTKTGFGGSSSFGRPAFGTPQQPSGFSSFGSTSTGGTSLFGTQPQQQTGGLFGQPQSTTTGFGATSAGFGGSGLFVSQSQQANTTGTTTGLFGSSNTPAFNTTQQKGPFNFATATTSTGTGLFGANTGSLFSTSTGGFGAGNAPVGTTVKYAPVAGTDTMSRNGVSTNIQTKIEVITCMKEYENKSLEELRVEDLLAGRKGPSQGTVLSGFGQPTAAAPQTGGLFGTQPTSGPGLFGAKPPENRSLFGSTTGTGGFGTGTTGVGLFGTSTAPTGFGQPSTAAAPSTSFSFGQNNKTTGSFGFGTTTTTPSLFGQPQQQQQPNTSGFGNFSNFGSNTYRYRNSPLFTPLQSFYTLTVGDVLDIQEKAYRDSTSMFYTFINHKLERQENTIADLTKKLEQTRLSHRTYKSRHEASATKKKQDVPQCAWKFEDLLHFEDDDEDL